MPALLHMDEIGTWLGEDGASAAELKALLRPYDGSLVMREQDSAKAKPTRPARPKAKEDAPGAFLSACRHGRPIRSVVPAYFRNPHMPYGDRY